MTTTKTCLRCGGTFEAKRSTARYDDSCRINVNRENTAARKRDIDEQRAEVRVIAESLRPYLMPEMYDRVDVYLQSIGIAHHEQPPIVPDRMPAGTMSNAGPDEGCSTTRLDLEAELEARRLEVIVHDWFTEHPNWLDGVNG